MILEDKCQPVWKLNRLAKNFSSGIKELRFCLLLSLGMEKQWKNKENCRGFGISSVTLPMKHQIYGNLVMGEWRQLWLGSTPGWTMTQRFLHGGKGEFPWHFFCICFPDLQWPPRAMASWLPGPELFCWGAHHHLIWSHFQNNLGRWILLFLVYCQKIKGQTL